MRRIHFEVNSNYYNEKYGVPALQFTLSGSSKQHDSLAHVLARVVEAKEPSRICIEDCFPEDKLSDDKFIEAYVDGVISLCGDIMCLLDVEGGLGLSAGIIVEVPSVVAQHMLVKLHDSELSSSVLIAEKLQISNGINMECFANRMEEMSTFVEEHIFSIDLPCEQADEFLDLMENYPYDVYFNDIRLL